MKSTWINILTQEWTRSNIRHYWLFPALFAGVIATTIAADNYWFLLVALVILWRIVRLAQPRVLLVSILVGITLAIVTGAFGYWIDQHSLSGQAVVERQILVYPDEIKSNGNLIYVVARNGRSLEKDTASYLVHSKAERARMMAIDQPTRWRVSAVRQPVIPATNEHQFDSARYYHQRRICNELRIKAVHQITPIGGWHMGMFSHQLRNKLLVFFDRFPQPMAMYCRQLVVGEQSVENTDLMENAKRLGIIHLFCISGMHVVLLVNLTRLVATYLWLEQEAVDRALLFFLPVYLVVGGGSVSLVRAVIMMEIILGRRYFDLTPLDGWAISLIVGLIWNPFLLLTLGGQLTYLLSLALHVLDPEMSSFRRCLQLSLLSLPSILSFSCEFHWLSLVASFVMIPLFANVLFPLVLVGAVTYPLFPLLTNLVNYGLIFFQRVLDMVAQVPGMIHFGKPPLVWGIFLFVLTLWTLTGKGYRRCAGLLVAYLACMLMIHRPLTGEVTFMDIGQGDSILVRTPLNRRIILIDTGGKLQFRQPRWAQPIFRNDGAQRATINYLKSKGISRIDTIYLSHHDADHIGYLPSFLKELHVKQVVVPAGMEKQPALLTKLARGRFTGYLRGVTDQDQVDPELRIVHPFNPGAGENADSLALLGEFGGHSFLFTGDLDRQGELAILKRYPTLRATVLKLGHHGSKTASDPDFLKRLAPTVGVISAGRFNRYHHPNEEVVTELRRQGISFLSTQQYGMIKYKYYGQHGCWQTTLKGDELRWTLPSSLNN